MGKQFISTQKYLIIGPRKVREIASLVKKLRPVDAIVKLGFIRKRGSDLLAKVIKTAVSQAKSQGIGDTDLVFKEIQVGEGPRLKRGRAVSRGRWHPYRKRMSHIRVVLTEVEKPKIEKGKNGTKS
jgi:large subunit ribosomal protein L22